MRKKLKKTDQESVVSDSADDLEEQRLMRNAELVRSMPDNIGDVLMKARSKPVWCSDTRWRMELVRRKRAFYYAL